MRDYTKILPWQKADDLTVAIDDATRPFPDEKLYGVTSQLRRAAYSVPAKIVEGASWSSRLDYRHFFFIARGSLNEARYFLHPSHRLGYLKSDLHQALQNQAQKVSRTRAGLIHAVESEAASRSLRSPVSGLKSPASNPRSFHA